MRIEVSQRYDEIAIDSVRGPLLDILLASDEQVADWLAHEEEALRTAAPLIEKYNIPDRASGPMRNDIPFDEADRTGVDALYTTTTPNRIREELVAKEDAMRQVVEDVYQGLTRHSGILFKDDLAVLHKRIIHLDETDEENNKYIPCAEDVPDFIAGHPITKEQRTIFATGVTYRAAKLLTPEIVDLILADEDRQEPEFSAIEERV